MTVLAVRRRVRPLRFAFLVTHRDADELRAAIRINTILWGGMFNAIIPVFARTPKSWGTTRTAVEIVRGYLDAFEPDYVVVGNGIDASPFGVAPANSVPLVAMLTREGLGERGLAVMDLYRWRFQREFRFKHRKPIRLERPKLEDGTAPLFQAAVFGDFPEQGPLDYFAKGFSDLGGKEIAVTAASYRDTLQKTLWPLLLGMSSVDERGVSGPRRTFFLVDPKSPSDLIDFWNLRALGWQIIAVPLPWASALAATVAGTIREEHQPNSVLPSSYTRAHILKGRAVSNERLMEFAKAVGAAGDAVVMQNWLPRIWEPSMRELDHVTRIDLSAREDETDARLTDGRIFFKTVAPKFVSESWLDRPRFANVIELRSYELPDLASVIPAEVPDLDRLLRSMAQANTLRTSSEGVAVLTDSGGRGISWMIPQGLRVFQEWFKARGELRLSGAGRIAKRMIDLLGGTERSRLVASVELIKILGKAADTASRDVPHEKLLALFKKEEQNNMDIVERRLAAMVRHKVLKFGMRLQCEQCGQHNWYALGELRDALVCHRCLDELPFPSAMPPRQPCWSYRPLGPFAVEGYAQGAYVVAAAIKTFRELGSAPRTTWVPSFTMTTKDGDLEADFGVFWEADTPRRIGPQLLLGECKTFDRFKTIDVKRMRQLGKTNPRALLVFATFNDNLDDTEKKLISPLALAGRRSSWSNPVMVLTRRELTWHFGPPYCWRHGTARQQKMADEFLHAPGTSLRRLADATQQLYLDLKPDDEWPHREAP